MPEKFPMFRRREFPKVGVKAQGFPKRAAAAEYDHRWERMSLNFRKKHPFCRFCEQEGYEARLADDVDHIVPIEDGGAKLDVTNLQSLCRRHHNGLKRRLQEHARKHGMLEMLPKWCAEPRSRPDFTRRR